MLPTIFVSHGAPTLPLNEASEVHHFLHGLLDGFKPRAILMISAHWEDGVAAVTGANRLQTIHDFYGFPPRLYELRYEPSGDPVLASQVADSLAKAGIESRVDTQRGIDHGGWTPLIIAAPGAGIPVVQLSLVRGLDAEKHIAIGRALRPLRKDVLIIGSGGGVHNLRAGLGRGRSTRQDRERARLGRRFSTVARRNAGKTRTQPGVDRMAAGARRPHGPPARRASLAPARRRRSS